VRFRCAIVCSALLAWGCVATARSRPTSGEAAAGPPPPPAAERTAGQLVARTPRSPPPDAVPDPRSHPGKFWVRGYWRWDGVRWVWMAGRWERERQPWARSP
jgi:hypothetical protein